MPEAPTPLQLIASLSLKLKLSTTINKRKAENMKYGDQNISMGFVEKFVEVLDKGTNFEGLLQSSQKSNGVMHGPLFGEMNYTI